MDKYLDRIMGKISERLKERCIAKLIEIDNKKHSNILFEVPPSPLYARIQFFLLYELIFPCSQNSWDAVSKTLKKKLSSLWFDAKYSIFYYETLCLSYVQLWVGGMA